MSGVVVAVYHWQQGYGKLNPIGRSSPARVPKTPPNMHISPKSTYSRISNLSYLYHAIGVIVH